MKLTEVKKYGQRLRCDVEKESRKTQDGRRKKNREEIKEKKWFFLVFALTCVSLVSPGSL